MTRSTSPLLPLAAVALTAACAWFSYSVEPMGWIVQSLPFGLTCLVPNRNLPYVFPADGGEPRQYAKRRPRPCIVTHVAVTGA
jgi:hypothetical protein